MFRLSNISLLFLLSVVATTKAAGTSVTGIEHLEARASCAPLVTIETRGTGEKQGPSAAFVPVMQDIAKSLGGDFARYNTKYPAADDQQSSGGTKDIIRRIKAGLDQCPEQQFLLLGVSQGAAATVAALQKIKPHSRIGRSIAGVLLYGNPLHRPNKLSNVDGNGKKTTEDVTGLSMFGEGIPEAWDKSKKVLDVCIDGDMVCSTVGTPLQHLLYPFLPQTNKLGSKFLLGKGQAPVKAFKIKQARLRAAASFSAKAKAHATKAKRAQSFGRP